MPDLGISTLDDVLTDVRRITDATSLPLLVDVDTGFGASAFNVARTVKSLIKFGAAAMHIEDQVGAKRCGHRPEQGAGVRRTKWSTASRPPSTRGPTPDFVIMARTDALAVEGLVAAIDRAGAYVDAGADMIFPEAITELAMYRRFADAVKVPILANITEFGATPLFTVDELRSADVAIALYPLSAFRAMNKAALSVYRDAAPRRHAESASSTAMQTAPSSTIISATTRTSEARRAVRQAPGAMSRPPSRARDAQSHESTDERIQPQRSRPRHRSPRNRSRCPASSPATPRYAPSAAPATTCTIAATTFSTSPTACEFEEIAYLLVHEKLPTAAELAAYKAKLKSTARHAATRFGRSSSSLPARAHPMDVMRTGGLGAGRHSCRARRSRRRRRARHRRPPDGEPRLDAALLVPLEPHRKRIDVETDDDSIGGHFLHLLHGKAPSASWVRAMHTSLNPLRRARIQRVDVHRARDRRHRLRHVLGDHRRHRRAARAEARRRQRILVRDPEALLDARRGRGRHPAPRRQQRGHHRLRSSGVHGRRPAQPHHQGGRARLSSERAT